MLQVTKITYGNMLLYTSKTIYLAPMVAILNSEKNWHYMRMYAYVPVC